MSSIASDIREKMMNILKNEEEKTDLENLSVLSRVGMKVASSTSTELDADATSASSTALIDLGLRLSEATAHGALTEIILHNASGYSILQAINDEYIVFGGLKNVYRVGYYLGYLRDLAKKLNLLISGNATTEMTLSLEESERAKLRKDHDIAEETVTAKPSVEQDKAALDDLLGFLDNWEKQGADSEDLETGTDNNIVSIPKSMSMRVNVIEEAGGAVSTPPKKKPFSSAFKVYDDEIPPVPLEDYTPMEIEEDDAVKEPKIVQRSVPEPLSAGPLPPLEDLKPPNFNTEFVEPASEYETEFVLDKESEAFKSILKDLGWDEEEK
jgi:predicted regulator of Ras-like GTPase activity (Roadblock/LC7/MglB family)